MPLILIMAVLLGLQDALPTTARAESPRASTQPTGVFEVSDAFPATEQYAKLVGPLARKYSVPLPGKSYAELRALRLTSDGHVHRPEPGSPTTQLALDVNGYTHFVPDSYPRRDGPFGLIVWIAPEKQAGMKVIEKRLPGWLSVMEQRKLIWVEPHNAPNESHSVWRAFAALEAVRHARDRYEIDPDRVYIAGLSGGGRISSHVAVFCPDVFTGAFAIVGCNFYKDVPVPNEKNRVWPGFWRNPDMKLVRRARDESRIVLLTGTNDFNFPSTKGAYDAFVKEKWKHVTYLEVPGMGHEFPPAEWFEKGIDALDAPLKDLRAKREAQSRPSKGKR